MAGYFSNHSQSRFLANSQTNNSGNTASSTTTTTTAASTTQSQSQNNQPNPGRTSRVPSRHFSTSLSGSGDEKSHSKEKSSGSGTSSTNGGTANTVHPLRNTWVFWFRQHRAPGNKITNYEEGIKKISAFSSVESFWSLWSHLHPPSSLLPTTDYLLFHSGIRRPVWEDPINITGGKWIIRLKKGVADRLWEDLILAIIGDQFDECGPEGDGADGIAKRDESQSGKGEWPEICGCTISVRQNEDIITVWNRVESDAKVKDKINQTIRKVLNLPSSTTMEYKSNNDSMQDKSSFRVPAADRTPLS